MSERWVTVVRSHDGAVIKINMALAIALVKKEDAGDQFKNEKGTTAVVFPIQGVVLVEQDEHTLLKGPN